MQVLDPLRIGQTVEEILSCDLAAELSARALYTEAAEYAITVHDRVTKELYDELLIDEEHHIDFLETQQELIRQVGVQLYSQKHIGGLKGSLERKSVSAFLPASRSKLLASIAFMILDRFDPKSS